MKKIIYTPEAPAAIGPYAQANQIGDLVFISGQIPLDPASGQLVEGIEKETHQVMRNLEAILREVDLDFRHVVKSTIFLTNMEDFPVVNEIYASYLEKGFYPARETVQVSALPKNVSVEISMIAHRF